MAFELPPPSDEISQHLQSHPYPPADPKFVRFYERRAKNVAQSAEQGRPIFEPVEFVEIYTAGDKDNVVDRPVREFDKYVWSEKYIAFKNGQSQDTGTPLEQWSGLVPGRAEELAHFKIRTVEQLADIPDGQLSRHGPMTRQEREKARAYLQVMKGEAPINEIRAENEALKKRLEALERLAQGSTAQSLAPQALVVEEQTGAPAENVGTPAKTPKRVKKIAE